MYMTVSVHLCASHTGSKSDFCSKFCHVFLWTGCFSCELQCESAYRFKTASQGEADPDCISLVGMFVFMALRQAKRGCIASVRGRKEEVKRKSAISDR